MQVIPAYGSAYQHFFVFLASDKHAGTGIRLILTMLTTSILVVLSSEKPT